MQTKNEQQTPADLVKHWRHFTYNYRHNQYIANRLQLALKFSNINKYTIY